MFKADILEAYLVSFGLPKERERKPTQAEALRVVTLVTEYGKQWERVVTILNESGDLKWSVATAKRAYETVLGAWKKQKSFLRAVTL